MTVVVGCYENYAMVAFSLYVIQGALNESGGKKYSACKDNVLFFYLIVLSLNVTSVLYRKYMSEN